MSRPAFDRDGTMIPSGAMPALSITEPWATLMAIGVKRIETRSWRTAYRGPIALHAAKKFTGAEWELTCTDSPINRALRDGGVPWSEIGTHLCIADVFASSRGHVIATARLVKCVLITDANRGQVPEAEWTFGNFAAGRFAWVFRDVVRLPEPVPAKGALGLWSWKPPSELRGAA